MTDGQRHHGRYVATLIRDTALDQHYRAGMPVEESNIERLAQIIKAAREDLDWSQDGLAKESGVSRPTIQRYENAKSRNPDPEHLLQIFKALKLDRREIPVILGIVTREEMGMPPEPVRILSRATQQIIDLLEDPAVSNAEKLAIVELLRARRGALPEVEPTERRKAG